MTRPSLLLADEPTGNLDSATAADILALFAELHAQGNTIVLVTHDASVAANANRAIRLRDGRIESVEVPTRGLSKHEVKKLAARFGRGDIVRHPHVAATKLRLANHEELEVFWTPTGP